MTGYGGAGIAGGGLAGGGLVGGSVGTLAATGAGSLLPAIAGVLLMLVGLLLVRLGAVRSQAWSQR